MSLYFDIGLRFDISLPLLEQRMLSASNLPSSLSFSISTGFPEDASHSVSKRLLPRSLDDFFIQLLQQLIRHRRGSSIEPA